MTTVPPAVLVLRPAPGNAETVARLAAIGVAAVAIPLFRVEPQPWAVPDPDAFDALLLTSANAVRHAGPGLAALRHLPTWCVGPATAAAARSAGLCVVHSSGGDGGGEGGGDGGGNLRDLVAAMSATANSATGMHAARPLWLCGQHRTAIDQPEASLITPLAVYTTTNLLFPPDATAPPCIAMLHSTRAARRFAEVVAMRSGIAIVAISAAVGRAAGSGWHSLSIADHPHDCEMVAIARNLCHVVGDRPTDGLDPPTHD